MSLLQKSKIIYTTNTFQIHEYLSVIIHFTVHYRNTFGQVHSLKSHIRRADMYSNMYNNLFYYIPFVYFEISSSLIRDILKSETRLA